MSGPTTEVTGVVDLQEGAGGYVRQAAQNYLATRDDVVVPAVIARDFALRDGTEIEGQARDGGNGRRVLVEVGKASGLALEEYKALPHFQDLVSVHANEPFRLAGEQAETSLRVIDLIAPIGRGQRGLIVSPPKAGKTTLLEHLGQAIAKHHPETHLIMLLIDERPEEVTHFRRAVKAEVLASSSDSAADAHLKLARLAIERAKRLVEAGRHVVILLDSLTRLGRASNREIGPGGRTMSGGVDNRALQFPRQFFGAARNCEGSGSLTILATALVDTGSRMDEVIFQEFKGTGNMELILDRAIADRRIFPAVDVLKSGTRREELLCSPEELAKRHLLRRALADLSSVEAAQFLIDKIQKTPSNAAFLGSLVAPAPTAARRFR
ncbi:MAG TPA: transcription termination factor Rho [Thermoleophilia bacterium]|jgi:transcription termination factor Rho|nr:transcription termination factor Rho [Thermoleophilia bacterium]